MTAHEPTGRRKVFGHHPVVAAVKFGAPLLAFAVVMLAAPPDGLPADGQRALAVMALAVGLWTTGALPLAVTGVAAVVLLTLLGATPDIEAALYGFSQPVPYFLIGVLTLGLGVQQSGLANRMAGYLIHLAGGSPRALYVQMLVSFAALTFALPSASTRGAILVHVYEQVMGRWNIEREHPLNKAVMLAMGSLNRLGSTALLAGGITPVVASSLIGDFSWTRWFVLMALPFWLILVAGGLAVFLLYRSGFAGVSGTSGNADGEPGPGALTPAEMKAGLIAAGVALLWFTDFAHGLSPAVPALIAMVAMLLPGIGLLSWRQFEQNLGWSNFFIIATSLSLSGALVESGAAAWFAGTLVSAAGRLADSPLLLLLAMSGAAAAVRFVMPNIAGYLAFIIPVAMSTGASLGLNPLVCGLAVVIVGDSVVFYPAAATASVFIYQRAGISAPEVLRAGVIMTLVAVAALFAFALPYWSAVGEGLTAAP
jgi:anion transporter